MTPTLGLQFWLHIEFDRQKTCKNFTIKILLFLLREQYKKIYYVKALASLFTVVHLSSVNQCEIYL